MSDDGETGASRPPDWYRDAVIYQLHVKSFFDGNDDGIGDFEGLLAKLDYIVELGVDTLWLLPFYPSPRRDDGYDVADYLGVHPDYGSLDDLRRFLDAAHQRGLRVLGDLVLNHTSDQHEWFQRARRAPRGSPEHEFYVWSDDDQRYAGTRIIFPDVEKSNWTWDPVAGRYYFHRFYAHQPDLNYDNPQVMEAMLAVARHWLDLGLDGFRLDAVAYLHERDGTSNENLPETHATLRRLRAELDRHRPGTVLLAEANQWPEDMKDYFGDDDECHMAFHFPLMPRMYMALAQEDRFPVTDILRQTPATPPGSQWAIFLRNHDELTLEMVTDAERDYLWNTYAADPRARLNLGIRRRLAPLLQRDRRRIELMTALLLTLPGTPVLYYGDEIGMGDNIHLGDRDGVRTPMQWSVDRNGGFSRADAQRLVLPTMLDPLYGYATVNVEAQRRDPHSLLHWTRQVIATRQRFRGLFGRGQMRFLYPRNRRVLAYLREHDGLQVLCVANLARTLQGVELDLAEHEGRIPVDLLGGAALPPVGRTPYLLTLPPYGFFALQLAEGGHLPSWHVPDVEPAPELPILVLRGSLAQALPAALEELQPPLLRWFSGFVPMSRGAAPGTLEASAGAGDADAVVLSLQDGPHRYRIPLVADWDGDDVRDGPPLARLRRGARPGQLRDALSSHAALARWRQAWRDGHAGALDGLCFQRLRPKPPGAPRDHSIDPLPARSGMRSVIVDGDLLVTQALRDGALDLALEVDQTLQDAPSPLLPITGVARVEGDRAVLVLAQRLPSGPGPASRWVADRLRRELHEGLAAEAGHQRELRRALVPFARLLGRRCAGLHLALASRFGHSATGLELAPLQEVTSEALRALAPRLLEHGIADARATRRALRSLERRHADLPARLPGSLQRVHGDLALANVLLTPSDLCFTGVAAPLHGVVQEGLGSPLSDLADLLQSLRSVIAQLGSETPEGPLPEELLDAQWREYRRALLQSYARHGGALPGDPSLLRRVLRVLALRRAVDGLQQATHRAALACAWSAFEAALH